MRRNKSTQECLAGRPLLTSAVVGLYYRSMTDSIYERLRGLSLQVARTLARPLFYSTFPHELGWSEAALSGEGLIRQCRGRIDESLLECAHGLCHCEAVARDAGALVMIEGKARAYDGAEVLRLAEAAVIAGLLHDIKRKEEDHAVRGSVEADRILTELGMDERRRSYVTYAIRSHEAFKAVCDLDNEAGCLVSDALYDADKFRWGPENFTTTVWTMVLGRETPPRRFYEVFPEKMQGIASIKDTFRTPTGRRYGPEIIDQGITIGNAIYKEMGEMLNK